MFTDEFYMRRCIELAKKGFGHVAPNPMVGCVIVHQGKIIGEGYHQKFGGPHAEVNAIQQVQNPALLKEAEVYVSLEPCAHYGKTPPCANLLITHQVKKVIIGCVDPFSEVAGNGIKMLQNAGIETVVKVLEEDCMFLNRRFFVFHQKKRPFILLKWAETEDGFMDQKRSSTEPQINWITHPDTQLITHQWRKEESAILVGRTTIENDNPSLTTRAISGRNPIRLVIDEKQQLMNKSFQIFNEDAETWVFNASLHKKDKTITWIAVTPFNLNEIVKVLHEKNVQSVLVEGGKKTIESFLEADLWDEARVLVGAKKFENGLQAPKMHIQPDYIQTLNTDQLKIYYKKS